MGDNMINLMNKCIISCFLLLVLISIVFLLIVCNSKYPIIDRVQSNTYVKVAGIITDDVLTQDIGQYYLRNGFLNYKDSSGINRILKKGYYYNIHIYNSVLYATKHLGNSTNLVGINLENGKERIIKEHVFSWCYLNNGCLFYYDSSKSAFYIDDPTHMQNEMVFETSWMECYNWQNLVILYDRINNKIWCYNPIHNSIQESWNTDSTIYRLYILNDSIFCLADDQQSESKLTLIELSFNSINDTFSVKKESSIEIGDNEKRSFARNCYIMYNSDITNLLSRYRIEGYIFSVITNLSKDYSLVSCFTQDKREPTISLYYGYIIIDHRVFKCS